MNLSTLTILNADDNGVARYTKNRTLRHAGFEVIDACSGAETLEYMQSLQPPLVLLDVRLGDVSGIEVCKIIKKRWPATIVLQTSATFVTPADRSRGLEGGADTYLIEPIDPDELVATVPEIFTTDAVELRVVNPEGCRSLEEVTFTIDRR